MLNNTPASHYHFPAIHPLPCGLLAHIKQQYSRIITVEDGCIAGGFGESVSQYLYQEGFTGKITHLGIPDAFITHGSNDILYDVCGYSPQKIAETIQTTFSK
jgi:1-deoxy-D-xylulose-5-phosphate synthase